MDLQIDGFRLSYEEQGEGIPLLLIHGFPLNREMWSPQFHAFAGMAQLIAPDLRGHGLSSAPSGPYDMDLLADDCLALLDHLNLRQPVVVCGLSMGGYVAMALCRRHADRIAGLILVSTRAGVDTPEGKANRERSAEIARDEGITPIVTSMLPKLMSPQTYENDPALVEKVKAIMLKTSVEGVIAAQLGMRDRPDSLATLQYFKKPAFIIHGEDDQIIPLPEAEAMKAALEKSELHLIPTAGHLPNMEQPERFNQIVRDFLKKLS